MGGIDTPESDFTAGEAFHWLTLRRKFRPPVEASRLPALAEAHALVVSKA
jgi:hypothetical protein